MRKLIYTLGLIITVLNLNAQNTASKPKLIVNIVVSQMRYDYLNRFGDNFSEYGFRSFIDSGTYFTNARHNYMQTNTVTGLATITTGAYPSEHGIVSTDWVDFTTNKVINLIDDSSSAGIECDAGIGNYSPRQLIAETMADRIKASDTKSKAISIALCPYSSIVAGGYSSDTYWMDSSRASWISSSFYFDQLPQWVRQFNLQKNYEQMMMQEWLPSNSQESYINKETTVLSFDKQTKNIFSRQFLRGIIDRISGGKKKHEVDELQYTPFGNTLTTQFAREAIIQDELGKDSNTDILTVVYDSPRYISEIFGPNSVEVEDMYYKLDREIGDLVSFIFTQVGRENAVIVLTSDHGSSNTVKEDDSRNQGGLFNTEQFKMILNGFLSAQYEPENWVTEYFDHQIYLNRNLAYNYGYNLSEMQTRASAFALQFRGIAGALTSTSMQNGYFGKGYAEKIQNSFYPKRSGDISINLMPGWIDESTGKVSLSGSLYDYDTHVPLMFQGGGINHSRIDRTVDVRSIAPTLSYMVNITVPNASSGEVLSEITGK